MKKCRSRRVPPESAQGMPLDSFCAMDGDTLVLNVLGTPSAGCDAIGQPKGKQLRISVTAAPVAGRATDHMLCYLAGEFGVTPDAIEVVFGRYNINKQLRIRAPRSLPTVIALHLAPDNPTLALPNPTP